MPERWHLPIMSAILAVLTAFSGFMAFLGKPEQGIAQQSEQNFPDVAPSYWAYPFIDKLAENNIIAGYPDGRYRPEQLMDRDEFAAIIRQSFNQERIRSIPSGSAFNDVPRNYWATQPIEEAYEMGFMGAFNGFRFRPQNEITRAQALASIAKGLNLNYDRSRSSSSINRDRTARNRLVFPLATTALMQPLLPIISQRQQPKPNNVEGAKTAAKIPAQRYLNLYYDDANQVSPSLVNPVAATTQANVVVNYPQPRLLNPNQPLKRSTAAAIIYRALVYQGKLQPLPNNIQATKYYPKPVKNVTTPAK